MRETLGLEEKGAPPLNPAEVDTKGIRRGALRSWWKVNIVLHSVPRPMTTPKDTQQPTR